MTTEEPSSGTANLTPRARRPHVAAGSRAVAVALSATAAASLMIAMGAADVRNAEAEAIAAAAPAIAPPTTIGGTTLPPGVVTEQPTTSIAQATPQPIVLQPEKRKVVAKSNGSR
ncbi:MAG: hypothetical protein M3132_00490 [Actinomycetia bacterium]|nr:hypothetical protein [Actinomycetes bacterium]